ncbi:MAG: alpha/beta fold hydrolase [Acidobacteria bacterium]|nr:alpha/beta fold hydrolase [Acidobacteriota bacterium]MBI3487202.1 alpha/beta fold hydrolase [Acidobacteriota bacterium]
MRTLIHGHQTSFTDEGKGQAILFVHGFPLNRGCWSSQVDGFKHRNRVIAPDLRGFGASEPRLGPASMDLFASDLFALCQHLKTGPVILVGHSMGGYVALAFAKAFPLFLRGLVLVGTRAGADPPEVAEGRIAAAKKVQAEGIASVVEAMAPKMLASSTTNPGLEGTIRELMGSSSAEGVASALLGMAERADRRADLADIRVPTLVLAGAEDSTVPPSESTALAEGIPGAELVILPKAGHLVAMEQSIAFNAALGSWLDASCGFS